MQQALDDTTEGGRVARCRDEGVRVDTGLAQPVLRYPELADDSASQGAGDRSDGVRVTSALEDGLEGGSEVAMVAPPGVHRHPAS